MYNAMIKSFNLAILSLVVSNTLIQFTETCIILWHYSSFKNVFNHLNVQESISFNSDMVFQDSINKQFLKTNYFFLVKIQLNINLSLI